MQQCPILLPSIERDAFDVPIAAASLDIPDANSERAPFKGTKQLMNWMITSGISWAGMDNGRPPNENGRRKWQ